MAKKHDYSSEYEQIVDNTTIIPVEIENEMKKSFMAYAMAYAMKDFFISFSISTGMIVVLSTICSYSLL